MIIHIWLVLLRYDQIDTKYSQNFPSNFPHLYQEKTIKDHKEDLRLRWMRRGNIRIINYHDREYQLVVLYHEFVLNCEAQVKDLHDNKRFFHWLSQRSGDNQNTNNISNCFFFKKKEQTKGLVILQWMLSIIWYCIVVCLPNNSNKMKI